ncbi:glycosyl hydrolase family 28-related protein [Halorubrum amylolyticum]|uniref:glycosyl hydrolase family 28-related protein n=1 Tax=Halorubrum amylolyticum TaxID=2508724 RepID=UPI0010087C86|nr:glycosyl hydrolase family 28-related protein [Halorubrum amylolyticum]
MVSRRRALALLSLSAAGLAGCNARDDGSDGESPTPPASDTPDDGLLNIRDFGAAVDGTTDDTQAVRDAIGAVGEGGTVYFPAGTTLVSADDKSEEGAKAIEVRGDDFPDGVTFRGDGEESVVRLAGGHEDNHGVFSWKPEGGISGHVVRDLTVDGNRHEQPADPENADNGLNLGVSEADSDDSTVDIAFRDVWSVDANTECFTFLQGGCVADRCTASGAGKHGFGIDTQNKVGPDLPPVVVRNSHAYGCDIYGIDCSGGTALVEDCVLEENGWGTKTTGQVFEATFRRVRLANNDHLGYQRNDTPTETGEAARVQLDHVVAQSNGDQGFRLGRDTEYAIGTVTALGNNSGADGSGNIAIMDNATVTADEVRSFNAEAGAGIHYWSTEQSTISRYVNFGNQNGPFDGELEKLVVRAIDVDVPNDIVDSVATGLVPDADEIGAGTGD